MIIPPPPSSSSSSFSSSSRRGNVSKWGGIELKSPIHRQYIGDKTPMANLKVFAQGGARLKVAASLP
eukprot:7528030-Pyramimonas_sp.AAC.1